MTDISNVKSVATTTAVKQLLRELKLSPNKLLGQNFLVSSEIAERIIRSLKIDEYGRILEIGAGLGALSGLLAESAASLSLLEVDAKLYRHLCHMFAENSRVEVIKANALHFDYAAYSSAGCSQDYAIIANLPYNITSPLLRRLLLYGGSWRSLTLMIQYEVAQKLLLASKAGASGPLALLAQYIANIEMLFTVPKSCFYPMPQVESAVIHMTRRDQLPFAVGETERFADFLEAAFSHRRKTLVNSLNNAWGGGAALWRQTLRTCGVDEGRRAEQLSLTEYGALFNEIERLWTL
ncbi:MAG: 16S rRNA (adenine(1518)-N(6)/adenine(1519)-N(6))-dimethyltransferase RsmA [Clostridiales bacterium]|nr:16S rRNA (adenine(1518)-N(6)/adenine(1519)-N(6))-dimethyltransferase RsmA [Clostridiales bacterium]